MPLLTKTICLNQHLLLIHLWMNTFRFFAKNQMRKVSALLSFKKERGHNS